MFCARCGKPLPEAVAFCPHCGAPVASTPGSTSASTPASAPTPVSPAGPAAGSLAIPYGGFWRRLLAFIVDGLIIGAVMLPFGVGLGLAHLSAIFGDEEAAREMVPAMLAASMFVWCIRVIVSWLYGAGFESSRFQATPGKLMVGVKVTDLEGGRITFARASGRQLGKWVSGLILGIGYLLVAFSDRKQGLHDMLAGTLVRRQG
jgi:uncharacterized RDD family membrane protein YckC